MSPRAPNPENSRSGRHLHRPLSPANLFYVKKLSDCRLYGILDLGYLPVEKLEPTARLMLEGGIDILQLRAKSLSAGDIRPLAEKLVPVCRRFQIPLILNDHPELVPLTGADGAHVGQDDLTVSRAREVAGPDAILGLSTHSLSQAMSSRESRPDYIGFGPLFATPTKPDYLPVGLEEIHAVHEQVGLPVFCIGGIKLENLPAVRAAGARRVVIVSGILQAADIAGYCRKCRALLD